MTRLACVSLFLLFSARFLSAQGEITGRWSGPVNETFIWDETSPQSCANGTPASFSTTGQSTLVIAQNGSNFAGSITFPHTWSDHRNPDNGQCMWVDSGSALYAVAGTVSGSSIDMQPIGPAKHFRGTFSVSGSTITGNFQADTESASFTLIKAKFNLPAEGDITGWWSGPVNETFFWDETSPQPCANGTPASFSTTGQSTLAIAQNGSNFAGSITFPHTWSDHRNPDNGQCMWVDSGSASYAVAGTVFGSSIDMQPIGPAKHFRGTFSVSGPTISGNFQADTESASLSLIKQSSAPPRRRSARH